MSAAIFGGLGSIASGLIGADSQRKTANKLLEAQKQQAFGSGQLEKTLIEIGIVCVAGFAVTFALVRMFRE
jgi:uncharacterized membrane protein YiaA